MEQEKTSGTDPRPQPSFEGKFYVVMALACVAGLIGAIFSTSWLWLAGGAAALLLFAYAGDTGLLPGSDMRAKVREWKARQGK
jgi:hypothetical protein